jgi:hypothetical protein
VPRAASTPLNQAHDPQALATLKQDRSGRDTDRGQRRTAGVRVISTPPSTTLDRTTLAWPDLSRTSRRRAACRTSSDRPDAGSVLPAGELQLEVSQLDSAEHDHVTAVKDGLLDAPAVDECAVEATVVEDLRARRPRDQDGVASRDGVIVEM